MFAFGVFLVAASTLPAAPPPTPAASPVATVAAPAAPATPAPDTVPTYSGAEQMQYAKRAKEAFIAQRQEKSQAFLDAHQAFQAAGGIAPAGLTSKEAIATRRELLAKCIAGNDDYINFIQGQEDTFRADLAATPLVPGDINANAVEFAAHANTAAIVKLRETERDALKCGDEMLATLEKSYGHWSIEGTGRLSFKRKSDVGAYSALSKKYNKLVADEDAMRLAINPTPTPSPTPAASASATPAPSAPPATPPASPGSKPRAGDGTK